MKRFFILFLLVISFCHCSYKKDSDPCDMGPYKLYIRVKENSPEYSSFFKQGEIDDNAIFLKIRDRREQNIFSIKKGLSWIEGYNAKDIMLDGGTLPRDFFKDNSSETLLLKNRTKTYTILIKGTSRGNECGEVYQVQELMVNDGKATFVLGSRYFIIDL